MNIELPDGPGHDDGDGGLAYRGVAERVPLHADLAEGFLGAGDFHNAGGHARIVLMLGARGWIGSGPWARAVAVLRRIDEERQAAMGRTGILPRW